ncbi:hypothetical protein [Sphingomonas sp. NFX23]|uniref:hypothetical protein n=1 Tax=Sphingomonas sp. NFX23 TaxID=2819532 RepID=UPI003CE77310
MNMLDVVEATVRSDHRHKVASWIAALKSAEASAVKADHKPVSYLINYRVSIDDSRKNGTEAERREGLTTILESMKPVDRHISTSTWLLRLHIQDAETVKDLLCGPLDGKIDGLHVSQVSPRNRAAFGVTNLG